MPGLTRVSPISKWLDICIQCQITDTATTADMPTLENQKEEYLAMEVRRADNRGPKGREIEIKLGGVVERCKLPHWVPILIMVQFELHRQTLVRVFFWIYV